jgi:2-octaprenyl-6-methoxyphenol hydroxylase
MTVAGVCVVEETPALRYAPRMTTPLHTQVLITGGGMVGMALALALAREGVASVLLEREAVGAQLAEAFDGRVSAVALGSQRLLAHIGAWEGMAAQAQPIHDIRVSDGGAPFFLHYDHREVGDAPFGWIVENRHIRAALAAAMQARGDMIRVLAPSRMASFAAEAGNVMATLADGAQIAAQLLVGADGKQSQVRALAGIGALSADYGQTAIVCTIAHEVPHKGLAQERFLPAGPFAVLPMLGDRSSLVWVEPDARVQAYLRLSEAECVQEIAERVGGYLGALTLVGPRFAYPLALLHAKSYVAPRVALIGDAAHAIHPIAGQGVNLGFRDVAVLAELLGDRARLGMDVGAPDVLAHYQRWRRFDNTTMAAVTDGLNRLFSNRILPVRLARGLGLWGVSKAPPLKRLFMRHAMGLTGDVPRLMR